MSALELHSVDTLIIGAGQAGLAAAYQLQQQGVDCLVLGRFQVVYQE